ncbi:putative membrane protein [Hartmannibacter diazotrophicus]|uniref:Putative membrane protein n=1 Tax=Hartmannibacter diazotrophicus TaxID=1482074 RepID=A0A2C9DCI0_9HYPH|nr:heparan-alpha-glucosaminide N-acetyltransferase [Hartmannibacter diazotrophicus]SON57880.1 putative membrane protein [Hartmannibacter diazotrophicus]
MAEAMDRTAAEQGKSRRIDLLDIARAFAILAMASYHFAWDLSYFGFINVNVASEPAWHHYAQAIASSFLILVGISLVLAHRRGFRLRPFLIRFGQIALSAAAITLVTYFVFPDAFIYFGILHNIAVASVLGLAFVRLPVALTVIAAAIALALPLAVSVPGDAGFAVWWTGLANWVRPANDFVPLFPWFGAVLGGIALGRIMVDRGWTQHLAAFVAKGRLGRGLVFAGRHSLIIYLIHQPLLFGLTDLAAMVIPPNEAAQRSAFVGSCVTSCKDMGGEAAFCEAHCGCVAGKLDSTDYWTKRFVSKEDQEVVAQSSASCALELQGDVESQ